MSDATTIPLLLDGDTGYGNFNNMRRLVKKLEQRDVAGVCIEDKIFPKTNSFLRGEQQPLADIEEFCGKIKAGKDSQKDDDFVIVARVEAFIAGWGLKEALLRAEAYRQAGADAILMHSKLANSSEIFAFLKEWDNRSPVVLVPTKYYTTPTDDFRKQNVSLVIWANHMVRGAILKMQDTAKQIFMDQNLLSVEDSVVPVKEIFRLQDDQEIAEAEKRYLSTVAKKPTTAIILAATRGKALGDLTENIPKTMLQVGNTPILQRIADHLHEMSINDINVVAGYKAETINIPNIKVLENREYKSAGQLHTLSRASDLLTQKTLIIFGDILFKRYLLQFLIDDPEDFVIIVDSDSSQYRKTRSDCVQATTKNSKSVFGEDSFATQIDWATPGDSYGGEWIGMLKLSPKGAQLVKTYLETHRSDTDFNQKQIRDMLNHFISKGEKIKIQYVSGHWVDVNHISDFTIAQGF